ncbi:MAG: CDP-diacylglycerol--serine O-phosphatidyltransferase [Roseovarius sp.]|uniref:CDP-diacylglycerol--serine O-phosphatidyltransferase n=2 Tax=Roseovarius sp. TaxID=1486281 RepID=UPI0032EE1AD4
MLFIRMLPNLMTLAAICAGLTAIRLGFEAHYGPAVILVLVAVVLDGLDGRVARMLGTDGEIGAELDSLADFLNFGVAPPLVVYFWALQEMRVLSWLVVLIFALCCVVRLARFNVGNRAGTLPDDGNRFVGIPAPAGATLAMVPMFMAFAFTDRPILPDLAICVYLLLIAGLMVSRIPTLSLKGLPVARDNTVLLAAGFVLLVGAFFIFKWVTMIVLCGIYLATVLWAALTASRRHLTRKR